MPFPEVSRDYDLLRQAYEEALLNSFRIQQEIDNEKRSGMFNEAKLDELKLRHDIAQDELMLTKQRLIAKWYELKVLEEKDADGIRTAKKIMGNLCERESKMLNDEELQEKAFQEEEKALKMRIEAWRLGVEEKKRSLAYEKMGAAELLNMAQSKINSQTQMYANCPYDTNPDCSAKTAKEWMIDAIDAATHYQNALKAKKKHYEMLQAERASRTPKARAPRRIYPLENINFYSRDGANIHIVINP